MTQEELKSITITPEEIKKALKIEKDRKKCFARRDKK